jgi:hypothetical protein
MASKVAVPVERIEDRILLNRGHKVLLDADLASLYGVTTKRLNEQVKRNQKRFPPDFVFRLTAAETEVLNRSHFATGSQKHRDPRFPPYAFTEHGAIMAAMVLNSPRATEVSVYVVRAFVRLRETLAAHKDLAAKLQVLEKKTEALALKHDTFAENTRLQLRQVFDAIRELMRAPEPKRRPIGFVTPCEKKRL